MTDYPHVQSAFVNAVREESTHDEACDYLQSEFNKTCALMAEIERLRKALILCLADLTADTIGTTRMDDPDWYIEVNHAVNAARATLEDK
jgi:histone deacetylase complex regulatory component SIN3